MTCLKHFVNLWVEDPRIHHHFAIIGGHWSSVSGDIKYLIYHGTSQKHVIEGQCSFLSEGFPWYVTAFPKLVTIGIVAVEIYF